MDLQAKGSATRPTLTGTIAGRDLHFSGRGIPQPVDIKAINLTLSPTEIRSNEFNATSGKTTVAARFAMLEYVSKSPTVDVQLRSAAATLPEIQSIVKAYGVTGLDQISGTGSLNFFLGAGYRTNRKIIRMVGGFKYTPDGQWAVGLQNEIVACGRALARPNPHSGCDFQQASYPDTLPLDSDGKENMTRADAIARARQHLESGEFLKILDRRVGYRTESQQPNSGAALRAYLVEDLQPAFAELDFTTRLISCMQLGIST